MTGQRLTVGPLTLAAPNGWDRIDGPPGTAVFAPDLPTGALFRPNIVVTAAAASGPIHVVSSEAIAAILAVQPRAQVLGVEPSEPHGFAARTIEYGYDAEQTWITVRQWFAVVDDQQVHVTGSCAVEDFEDLGPAFRAVVASVARPEGT